MISEKINESLKQAMLLKTDDTIFFYIEEGVTQTLSITKSDFLSSIRNIKSKLIEASKIENKTLDEKSEVKVLEKMIRDREKSIDFFEKGNRKDLISKEQTEIKIIKSFLPEKPTQLSEEKVKQIISNLIEANNYSSMKDMGKLMKQLDEMYPEQIDKKLLSQFIKEKLS